MYLYRRESEMASSHIYNSLTVFLLENENVPTNVKTKFRLLLYSVPQMGTPHTKHYIDTYDPFGSIDER